MLTPTAIIFANQYETILPFKLWFCFLQVLRTFILFPTILLIVRYLLNVQCSYALFVFVLNAFLNCRPHKFPFHTFSFAILPCNVFQHSDLYRNANSNIPTPIFGSGLMYGNGISFLNVEHVKKIERMRGMSIFNRKSDWEDVPTIEYLVRISYFEKYPLPMWKWKAYKLFTNIRISLIKWMVQMLVWVDVSSKYPKKWLSF